MYKQPNILILDEPTIGLDNITKVAFAETLKKATQKITVIIITHELSIIKNSDCIYLIEKGKIIANGTYESLSNESIEFQRMNIFAPK